LFRGKFAARVTGGWMPRRTLSVRHLTAIEPGVLGVIPLQELYISSLCELS